MSWMSHFPSLQISALATAPMVLSEPTWSLTARSSSMWNFHRCLRDTVISLSHCACRNLDSKEPCCTTMASALASTMWSCRILSLRMLVILMPAVSFSVVWIWETQLEPGATEIRVQSICMHRYHHSPQCAAISIQREREASWQGTRLKTPCYETETLSGIRASNIFVRRRPKYRHKHKVNPVFRKTFCLWRWEGWAIIRKGNV